MVGGELVFAWNYGGGWDYGCQAAHQRMMDRF
jgi:hypothetical protein